MKYNEGEPNKIQMESKEKIVKTVDYYMKLPYRMEIIPDKEEGGFIATFPELPGCITVGDTIEAVIQNIVDAKRAWLEAELEIGAMIPEPEDFRNGGHDMTKRSVYPIIISEEKDGFYVSIPDFETATQGECIADAIMMARDVIGLMGIDMQDEGKELPIPNSQNYKKQEGDIVTLVDVDFAEYRKRVDNRAVKKNCTIPYWLSVEAEKVGINYSRTLQEALVNILGVTRKIY